jgi:hypothetical protein
VGTQSPIDLPGKGRFASSFSAWDDNFNKMYYNQRRWYNVGLNRIHASYVKFLPKEHTSKTVVTYPDLSADPGTKSFFYSEFGDFIGAPRTYEAN